MKTEWETPFEEGPCVFVGNHVGAIGPVDMCTKFPLWQKSHPWINAGMLDAKEVPAYVRQDYWWKPGSFFEPVLNVTVPYMAAAVVPPILRSLPYIPVYHDQRIIVTMRESIKAMKKGDYLIIFPEQPSGWLSHHEWINTGWLRLGELWYRASGRALKMYPVHIDRKGRKFVISKPVWYDPARRFAEQEKELAEALARGLRGK
jgi:hypothetical protein